MSGLELLFGGLDDLSDGLVFDAVGVEDWRVLFSGAHAYFHVGSFAEAARFVAAIAEVAEVVGHFPDVDVRPEGVTVRTASGEYGALSDRDVELARRISEEARKLRIEPDLPEQSNMSVEAALAEGGVDYARALLQKSLGADRADEIISRLAATIEAWWPQIEAFLLTGITNAASEGINRLIKLEARNAFGFRNPINQRLRSRCASIRATGRPAKPG